MRYPFLHVYSFNRNSVYYLLELSEKRFFESKQKIFRICECLCYRNNKIPLCY